MFEGFLDQLDNYKIRGWCKSIGSADPVFVGIFINDKAIASILADIHREDLETAGKGNGNYGFEYVIPNSLLSGSTFKVNVKYLDCDLVNSPSILHAYISGSSQSNRERVAKQYLSQSGLEIGALHNPLLIDGITIKYVDRMSKKELGKFYNDIHTNIVDVDIVDEGESLTKIEDNSQNFIICNHMLEHCVNPIGTIKNHLQKIKRDGILFYSVPDKRFTFDQDRPLTEFNHLMMDYEGEINNLNHYKEWAVYHMGLQGNDITTKSLELLKIEHNIHFHVWDFFSFTDFLLQLKNIMGFEILNLQQNFNETIAVLKK